MIKCLTAVVLLTLLNTGIVSAEVPINTANDYDTLAMKYPRLKRLQLSGETAQCVQFFDGIRPITNNSFYVKSGDGFIAVMSDGCNVRKNSHALPLNRSLRNLCTGRVIEVKTPSGYYSRCRIINYKKLEKIRKSR